MFKKYKGIISTILWCLLVLICICTRIILVKDLPVFAYIDYADDDCLMVEQAISIIDGKWLGTYGYNTILKSPVFPSILAMISNIKISYIFCITFIYAISCLIYDYSIKEVIKNKWIRLVLFIINLFNPIMFSNNAQRVYRNSLVPSLALIIIALLNIMLIDRFNKNKRIIRFIIADVFLSLVFPIFYFLREDSMWIIPIIAFYFSIILITEIIEMIKNKKITKDNILKIILLVMPILFIMLFTNSVKNLNYKYYGAKVVNAKDFDGLNNFMNSIAKVKNPEHTLKLTNTRAKIKMLYEKSDSLNEIKDQYEMTLDNLSGEKDGELGDGMFSWGILNALVFSGYDTFPKQNDKLNQIANEINDLIKNNQVEIQETFFIMPSVLKDKFDMNLLINRVILIMEMLNDYNDLGVMDTYGSIYNNPMFFEPRVKNFMKVTNDKILLNKDENSLKYFSELIKENNIDYIEKEASNVKIITEIRDFISIISKPIAYIGIVSYIIITIIMLVEGIKFKSWNLLNSWIILSGVVGSMFTFVLGIALTTVMVAEVNTSFYLMSAYVLNLLFSITSILVLIEKIVDAIKNKFFNNNEKTKLDNKN